MDTTHRIWPLILNAANQFGSQCLAVDEQDNTLTFKDYAVACEQVAATLHNLGIKQHSVVSWILPTWIESFILAGALARLDAIQNPLLPIYREREIEFIIQQTHAEFLIIPCSWRNVDYAAMTRSLTTQYDITTIAIENQYLLRSATNALPAWQHSNSTQPNRWYFYTSGTTANPKGVIHTDLSLIHSGQILCDALDLQSNDRAAMVFPFTHVGGINWLIAALMSGSCLICIENFSANSTMDVLSKNNVTLGNAGMAFWMAYRDAQEKNPHQPLFSSIRAFPGGGAPKSPTIHAEMKALFGGAGVISGYGMTECPIFAMNSIAATDEEKSLTEGPIRPQQAELKIVDSHQQIVAKGNAGELCIKGPQLFNGYLDPTLNHTAFEQNGFFRTGDIGYIDEKGNLVISGRTKDIIIRKGENISAREIEDLLYLHPKIHEAAVIGLPHQTLGEMCCAVIVTKDLTNPLSFDEMVNHLKEQKIMAQKIPERLEHLEQMPRNMSGKILKVQLIERFS